MNLFRNEMSFPLDIYKHTQKFNKIVLQSKCFSFFFCRSKTSKISHVIHFVHMNFPFFVLLFSTHNADCF